MSNEIAVKQAGAADAAPRKTFVPRVDARESREGITLLADMPGVDENGVEVTVEGRTLLLEGRAARTPAEGFSPLWAEYTPGDYRRRFSLSPERVDIAGIRAELKDGVLKVTLPKVDAAKRKKIDVKAV